MADTVSTHSRSSSVTNTPSAGPDTTNWLNSPPDESWRGIVAWGASRKLPSYRTRQIHPYLWVRPISSWAEATDIPIAIREELQVSAPLLRFDVVRRQCSNDGTVKLLFRLPDGAAIESVWIPEGRRTTLCISSQAGCAYGCVFCATGRMGFQRHLAPWEIAGQVRAVILDPELGKPTNVVFMGMGEPLHNWLSVDAALTILNDPRGLNIGARHITVSTIGILPRLAEFGERPEQFRLAVSLHAATSERRSALMPIELKYPLDQLITALERFRRRITLEYVMIRGMNDAPDDADALAAIASRLSAHVNLLPLHPGGTPGLEPTPVRDIVRFAKRLEKRGVAVTVRRSRGLDISAACGQLRVEAGTAGGIKPQHDRDVEQ